MKDFNPKKKKKKKKEHSGRIEKILISLIFICLGVEKWRMEKMSLYKFAHTSLLKNDDQLKQKKSNHPIY